MANAKTDALKQQGNECVKKGNYSEAILHYSHAIQQDDKNAILYSNRSLAFLKLQQYYYAMEDAKTTIKLNPSWPKGHFRKGEVEFAVGNYTLAIMSYKQALLLDPNDSGITEAVQKSTRQVVKQRKEEKRRPWLYGGSGLLLGLLIVLCDHFLAEKPTVQNVFLQILLITVFVGLGLLLWLAYRYIQENQRESLLDPPVDLLSAMKGEEEQENEENPIDRKPHRKGGVSSARQRYKKGKS